MAKDKERNVNPAQAQRKADKAKALKKARGEHQARRNEKLARRNPNSIQRQIDELKALDAAGDIKTREKAILAELERDLKAVLKARESQGGGGGDSGGTGQRTSDPRADRKRVGNDSILGKRRHDGTPGGNRNNHQSSGSDTDESVRNIPMPRDTPPPMPREHRRPQRPNHQAEPSQSQPERGHKQAHELPSKPSSVHVSKTTYSSAPQIRDLKKEATSRFVPDAVRRKQDAARGQGGLLEPEEMDKLEREGYYGRSSAATQQEPGQPGSANQDEHPNQHNEVIPGQDRSIDTIQDVEDRTRRLRDEEERFQRELAEDMEVDDDDIDRERDVIPHTTTATVTQQNQVEHRTNPEEAEEDDDADDDEDEDDYLPPMMNGKGSSSSNLTDTKASATATAKTFSMTTPTASSIAAGLFAKLPPPRASTTKGVEMEEVEDEDL